MTKQKSEYGLVMPQSQMTWRHEKHDTRTSDLYKSLPELRQTKAQINKMKAASSLNLIQCRIQRGSWRSLEPKLPAYRF